MVDVHKLELRAAGAGFRAILLVRLSNGKLRSFSGVGDTPMEAHEDALKKARADDGQ